MPNIVSFAGRECRVDDRRRWSAVGHDDAGLIRMLDAFSAGLPGSGPQDGFASPGRVAAEAAAHDLNGKVVELDPVTIPPPRDRPVDY